MAKVSVCVIAVYVDGEADVSRLPASKALAAAWRVIPLKIRAKDVGSMVVDRVTDIRCQASTKAGGLGNRYTCRVTAGEIQREIFLYKNEDDWFMEDGF